MKGILLAGGSGTRLDPLTRVVSKQLLPVYDKPIIYYSLSILMLAGIREILIISTPEDLPHIEKLLGDGTKLGLKLSYKVQDNPNGLAEAFVLGDSFIGRDSVCLVLGDNILYGNQVVANLKEASKLKEGAILFGYHVKDPQRFGVLEVDKDDNILSIEEKPDNPRSNYAAIGVYFYDNDVVRIAKDLMPSDRGELEITDVNKVYLERKKIKAYLMGRGYYWIDVGTIDSLNSASDFMKDMEDRHGWKVACIEEIALKMNYISVDQFKETMASAKADYLEYLKRVLKEEDV